MNEIRTALMESDGLELASHIETLSSLRLQYEEDLDKLSSDTNTEIVKLMAVTAGLSDDLYDNLRAEGAKLKTHLLNYVIYEDTSLANIAETTDETEEMPSREMDAIAKGGVEGYRNIAGAYDTFNTGVDEAKQLYLNKRAANVEKSIRRAEEITRNGELLSDKLTKVYDQAVADVLAKISGEEPKQTLQKYLYSHIL